MAKYSNYNQGRLTHTRFIGNGTLNVGVIQQNIDISVTLLQKVRLAYIYTSCYLQNNTSTLIIPTQGASVFFQLTKASQDITTYGNPFNSATSQLGRAILYGEVFSQGGYKFDFENEELTLDVDQYTMRATVTLVVAAPAGGVLFSSFIDFAFESMADSANFH